MSLYTHKPHIHNKQKTIQKQKLVVNSFLQFYISPYNAAPPTEELTARCQHSRTGLQQHSCLTRSLTGQHIPPRHEYETQRHESRPTQRGCRSKSATAALTPVGGIGTGRRTLLVCNISKQMPFAVVMNQQLIINKLLCISHALSIYRI